MPSNAPSLNPFTRLTFSEETKTLSEFVSQVSVLSLPVFTITFLKFILFFLLIFCVHRRAHLLLCDKQPLLPDTALIVQRSLHFWPHFFILHTALPLFVMNFQVIYFCSVSVCTVLHCTALPGNEGNPEWNTEVVNVLLTHNCILLQLKKAWKYAS